MSLISDAIKSELRERYSAAGRFYHTMAHVEALLALLQQHRAQFSDPEAVEAAIWFHDAIYDAERRDNEEESAKLAVYNLTCDVESSPAPVPAAEVEAHRQRVARIRDMILATATHTVPEFSGDDDAAAAVEDARMFLDMDLSILGAPEEVFDDYEVAVRQEYAWADDEMWRRGRAEVLRSFLGRAYIYHSGLFRGLLEEHARGNLARSLSRLTGSEHGVAPSAGTY